MIRGQIRWYTFRSPDKRRPVLLLTRTAAYLFFDQRDHCANNHERPGYPDRSASYA